MKYRNALILALITFSFSSCVSVKKYKSLESEIMDLQNTYQELEIKNECNLDSINFYKVVIEGLQSKLLDQAVAKDQLLNQLENLSVISENQSESIKKSLDNISGKDNYIKDLRTELARKDSLNMVLVMNLKGAIGNLDDDDIKIKIQKGVIYIDISDKLLFKTGKYEVTEKAKGVLGKVAMVLLKYPEIEFMVEGHTDSVPFRQGLLLDNWDLSLKRASSVIRILQYDYHVPPARMVAAGRGQYIPLTNNDTNQGRALNRRTRIIILPQLDQFFKLIEKQEKGINASASTIKTN